MVIPKNDNSKREEQEVNEIISRILKELETGKCSASVSIMHNNFLNNSFYKAGKQFEESGYYAYLYTNIYGHPIDLDISKIPLDCGMLHCRLYKWF